MREALIHLTRGSPTSEVRRTSEVGLPPKNEEGHRFPPVASMREVAPPCRVLRGFEPAFAGGDRTTGFALAAAYRVPRLSATPIS